MTNGEFIEPTREPSFEEVTDLISKLVEPHSTYLGDEDGEVEFPGWDGSIGKLNLDTTVADKVGLGQSVRARVIGDFDGGIAIIMRSRNLFDTRHFGFFLSPTLNEGGPRGLEVWQAPAQKPKRGKYYWGFELLDSEHPQQTTPEATASLLKSLREASLSESKD
jgi:hypothetical protein